MNKQFFFERNMLALSRGHEDLCHRLSGAETTLNRYKMLEGRNGDIVPAIVDAAGAAHPLHSTVDPQREGRRLLSTVEEEGFLVLLGFGGGYHVQAALERPHTGGVLVIDYDINGFAELLCAKDHARGLEDPRLKVLIDPEAEDIERSVLELYRPALCGGIRVLPLRARTELDTALFNRAAAAVQEAIGRLSADYSVQAWFGTRWFSNIIRNLKTAANMKESIPPIRRAAVCAAGPSLDGQLDTLRGKRDGLFIIATDTSLPALLGAALPPDAVLSIDCQHISYHHFLQGLPAGIPLFLDLASPPLLAERSTRPLYFCGGHPLSQYVTRHWRPFPRVDSSGGNVTFAAFSLAESLGAAEIELYGADFSYPLGRAYARGTYLFPYFDKTQDRLCPLENHFSRFLYRSAGLVKKGAAHWYYETETLARYRQGLEAKVDASAATVSAACGIGAPLRLGENRKGRAGQARIFCAGAERLQAADFLRDYREQVACLPVDRAVPEASRLSPAERSILNTLLPQAAAIKRRNACLNTTEVLETVREYSLAELDRVLASLY